MWIASFDIGKKNFSFYIEEINQDLTKKKCNIDPKNRFNKDGTLTEEFSDFMDDLCLNGKKVLLSNNDITDGSKNYIDYNMYHNMTDLLDKYETYWDKCSIIVIEKQMSFGKRNNTMAVKLGQHCWSYFSFKYGRFKDIIEFPAYHKTQVLGCEKVKTNRKDKKGRIKYKAITKYNRKKWCINKGLKILEDRGDTNTIDIIKDSKKKDDLCDVICQLQAFKYIYFFN